MKRAFVTYGGWEGHQPEACAAWVADVLRRNDFEVELSDALAQRAEYDLIVPVWSIAEAPEEELDALVAAVERGTGLAAFHGAAATFRTHEGYQRLLGGQFVWHPEPLDYEVELVDGGSFRLTSEQYYLHVDPANEVLATTRFADGTVMPAAWRRRQGAGRIFYSALGHSPADLELEAVRDLFERGALWATR
jgi:type 1 glutamine amidotransferase